MTRVRLNTLGAPRRVHRHTGVRLVASLISAAGGGIAVLLIGIALVGGVTPGEGAALWIAAGVLVATWLTGIWWRWDSPGRRNPHLERERRGF